MHQSQSEGGAERESEAQKYLTKESRLPGGRWKCPRPLLLRFHHRWPKISDKPSPCPNKEYKKRCNKKDSGPLCSRAHGEPLRKSDENISIIAQCQNSGQTGYVRLPGVRVGSYAFETVFLPCLTQSFVRAYNRFWLEPVSKLGTRHWIDDG